MMKRALCFSAVLASTFICSPVFAATCALTNMQVKSSDNVTTANIAVVDSGDGSGNCLFVTKVNNVNANGQNNAANSSPTVPPSDMAGNVPIANLVFGTTAAMTGTSSTQLLAATASKITYVSNISCVNSSSTGTFVTVQDGSGGTTLGTLTAAPSYGGDEQHNSVIPLYKTSSGNGLFVANVTTSANVICSASGWHN